MFLKKPLASIPVILSMTLAGSPLFAATQIDLSKSPIPALSSVTAAVGSQSPVKVISSHTDKSGVNHVRIQQLYADYPVWGADAVVHVPKTAANASLKANAGFISTLRSNPALPRNGFFYADINKDLANADPAKFDTDAAKRNAVEVLKQAVSQLQKDRFYTFSEEEARVVIYIDDAKKAHTAFQVSMLAAAADHFPKRPTAVIDAQDYTIYKQWNDVKTLEPQPAEATGFGGNPLLGKIQYGKDKPALQISRDAGSHVCYVKNEDVEVLRKTDLLSLTAGTVISFDCANPAYLSSAYAEPEGGYLGQFNYAYSPVNDAMHEGMVIKKLYQDWYGITVLTKRDQETPLLLSMNLIYLPKSQKDDGSDVFENAFWESRSQKMYFGLGGDELYPLVTLDVAAHEISHGFTDQHSSLIYMDQSGALNESFSDMAAVAASYYDSDGKSTNWMIGGEIMKENLGKPVEEYAAIRYINDPGKDGASIDNAAQYPALLKRCKDESRRDPDRYQSCIVHLASGVFNKVFYELATSAGWSPKTAFALMLKANEDYWTSSENYQTAACGVKKAATEGVSLTESMEASKTLDRVFKDVGISLSSC